MHYTKEKGQNTDYGGMNFCNSYINLKAFKPILNTFFSTNRYIRETYNSQLQSDKQVILDKNDCISHSTNTLGKGMNQIILPPVMGK